MTACVHVPHPQIAPIRNTSAVFAVLYVMERACDFMLRYVT